jgi:hypothetical protein
MGNFFNFFFLFVGAATAQADQLDSRFVYCKGELPGYGYSLRVVDSATVDLLSVTSTGRFFVDPLLPKQEHMLSLRGTLVGTQHRWSEERVIRVTENLFSQNESKSPKILEISEIPFFCTHQMPPNFQ